MTKQMKIIIASVAAGVIVIAAIIGGLWAGGVFSRTNTNFIRAGQYRFHSARLDTRHANGTWRETAIRPDNILDDLDYIINRHIVNNLPLRNAILAEVENLEITVILGHFGLDQDQIDTIHGTDPCTCATAMMPIGLLLSPLFNMLFSDEIIPNTPAFWVGGNLQPANILFERIFTHETYGALTIALQDNSFREFVGEVNEHINSVTIPDYMNATPVEVYNALQHVLWQTIVDEINYVSDGTPLTPAEFKSTLRYILAAGVGSEMSYVQIIQMILPMLGIEFSEITEILDMVVGVINGIEFGFTRNNNGVTIGGGLYELISEAIDGVDLGGLDIMGLFSDLKYSLTDIPNSNYQHMNLYFGENAITGEPNPIINLIVMAIGVVNMMDILPGNLGIRVNADDELVIEGPFGEIVITAGLKYNRSNDIITLTLDMRIGDISIYEVGAAEDATPAIVLPLDLDVRFVVELKRAS
ncbi:MAG: hypothetical protein FWC00_02565 [Firmicutes bacterium]|nr:hypothetical protein [Bacillota bacterium]